MVAAEVSGGGGGGGGGGGRGAEKVEIEGTSRRASQAASNGWYAVSKSSK